HHVFLFVVVFGAQDFVDDVAVVGEQNQSLGILVQTADREDPLAVPDELDDVVLDLEVGGAGDARRLVERHVDMLFFRADELAVQAHLVACRHLRTEDGAYAVAGDASRFDPLVGFAPRTRTGFADVFVEPHAPLPPHRSRKAPICFANSFGAASNASAACSVRRTRVSCLTLGPWSMTGTFTSTTRRTRSGR